MIAIAILLFLSRYEKIDEHLADSAIEKVFIKSAAFLYRRINRNGNGFLNLYKRISKKERFFQKEQVVVDLHTLEPVKSIDKLLEQYYVKKISIAVMLFLGGGFLLICLEASNIVNNPIIDGKYIDRYASGEGDRYLSLEARIGDEQKENVNLTVTEQKYSEEELDSYAEELALLLETHILGENNSVDNITKDMKLVSHVDGYPFSIKYQLDNTDYIDSKGKLFDEAPYGEDVEAYEEWNAKRKDGILINISVILEYESYKKELIIPVMVREKEKTKEQIIQEQLNYLLKKADKKDMTKTTFELPQKVDGERIVWERGKEKTSRILLVLIIVVAIALYWLKDKDLHDCVVKRETQLLTDYPELVSKITLLTGAGLTVRNCFYRIAKEYRYKREQGYEKHYAYEEILLTVYEMESGISEVQAYENYGKRCRIQQYIKLSALLVQNLKKSSSGLFAILQEEATDSFDLRKNMAKKLGEEAGTKMLLPMILMLGIVMVIIFYPAMTSFAS